MKFKGFIGGSYKLSSPNFDRQRSVNLFPIFHEKGTGKEGEVAMLVGTEGLREAFDLDSGEIRCIHRGRTGLIFVAAGDRMYLASRVDGVWGFEEIGELQTETGIIIAASSFNEFSGTGISCDAVFVDGVKCYAYARINLGDGTFTQFDVIEDITSPSLPYNPIDFASHVVWIDGYFIFNDTRNGQFRVSDLNSGQVDPLSFATAEGDPDKGMSLGAKGRDLWIVSERSTEIWKNTGNPDFPFERVGGGFIEKGTIARYSVKVADDIVIWLGVDKDGGYVVYGARGMAAEDLSTEAVEYAISTYAHPEKATAWVYRRGKHCFYVLNFEEATWVYDLKTREWHERARLDDGIWARHPVAVSEYIPDLKLHLVGDYRDGRVYILDPTYYKNGEDPLVRMRISPHISAELKRMSINYFELDFEAGVGLDGLGQGTDPQVMLDWSDDGGRTWSNERTSPMGKIGATLARAVFWRLGMSRDRIFRVRIADPVKVVLLSANITIAGVA